MRLLIATGVYPPESGGPATYTKLLEEKLPLRDIQVHVLPFRVVRHLPPGVRHIAYFWKCFRLAREADVIFAQDTVSVGVPAACAARLTGKPLFVRVPGDYAWEQGVQRFGVNENLDEFQKHRYGWRVEILRTLQRFTLRRARYVITPSKYLKNIVRGWGIAEAQVILIYNGIELPITTIPPAARPQGFLVVSAGRRVPWKGFESLERIVTKENTWHFFIAENLPRPEALGWVQAADAFVLNSTYEGLSHLLIEAMSFGVPIVATRVGGNPELVTDGVEGLLIPPQDDEALYEALKKIERDPIAARVRGTAAAERAKEFSVEKTLDVLCQLLHTV
jgi:glycosyltransferase involved in cell wall biosynthesis